MTENHAAPDPTAATAGSTAGYPRVDYDLPRDSGVDFPALEERVLAQWASDGTFEASLRNRDGADEFVFYDGPPFANGLPH